MTKKRGREPKRILYLAILFFRIGGEIKAFIDNPKLIKPITNRLGLHFDIWREHYRQNGGHNLKIFSLSQSLM